MLKRASLFLIFLLAVMASACQPAGEDGFAIYLLTGNPSPAEGSRIDIDRLPIESEPFLSGDDIVSYDKTNHVIELTQAAYTRFRRMFPMPVNGIPFVVCVGTERIYAGAFWTPISSLSYDGVVIMPPFDPNVPIIRLNLGYPGPGFFTGMDPRLRLPDHGSPGEGRKTEIRQRRCGTFPLPATARRRISWSPRR